MPLPGEPLWTDEDRAWALALADIERDACPGCGEPWSESSDKDSEGQYTAEVLRCHACAAGAAKASAFQEGNGDIRGLHIAIRKKV